MRMLVVAMVGTILLVGGSAKVSGGQMQIPGSRDGLPQQMPGHRDRDNADSRRSQALAKMRNEDRQKKLVADTERLLELATDLKAQVGESAASLPDNLSEDGMKKVEEIEKLAHSVKERMKG